MTAGHVNRSSLESFYQNPGDIYDDTKTEGALDVIADQVDENWDDQAAVKASLNSTTAGASGAHYVKSSTIPGVTGTNVGDQLASVKSLLDAGAVGNGTIDTNKLAPGAVTAAKVAADIATQAELDAHAALTTGAHGGITPASHVGSGGAAHAAATTGANGFMSSSDKTKLDGIAAGAEVNQNAFSKVKVDGQSDIDAATDTDALTLEGGTGITVTTDPVTKKARITATGDATPGAHASSHITGGTDVIPNAVAGGNAGLMSGTDKSKIDSLSQKGEPFGVTTGTGTAYTVTAVPAITSLADGVSVAVKWHVANGASPTISPNGLAAKPILKPNGNAPAAGTLKQDAIATLRHSSTANAGTGAFILQGEGGEYGTAGAAQVLAPYTIGTDSGLVPGTMPENGALTVTPTGAAQNFGAGHYSGITVNAQDIGMTPGAIILGSANTTRTTSSLTNVKLKEFLCVGGGKLRITYQQSNAGAGTDNATTNILRLRGSDLTVVGTTRINSSGNFVTYTEDIDGWKDGDLIQIVLRESNSSYSASVRNATVGIAPLTVNLD